MFRESCRHSEWRTKAAFTGIKEEHRWLGTVHQQQSQSQSQSQSASVLSSVEDHDDHVQQEHSMMMMLPPVLKGELALLTLFVGRVLLLLGPCYLLCTGIGSALVPLVEGSYSDFSRDDTLNGHDRMEPDLGGDGSEDSLDDSQDTASHLQSFSPPRPRNKKRILTNTKLFYFLQNPTRQLATSESRRSQVDQIADKTDCKTDHHHHHQPTTQPSVIFI